MRYETLILVQQFLTEAFFIILSIGNFGMLIILINNKITYPRLGIYNLSIMLEKIGTEI